MKQLLFYITLFVAINTQATDYYLSNAGSDAAAGTSTGTAWATIGKLNTQALSAGDRVFFRRGDTFYGSITVNGSGTSGSRITFDAYGSGALPVISGWGTLSTTNTDWTQVSTNVWELNAAVTNGLAANLNMVTVNGVVTSQGRFPNETIRYGSYFKYQTHTVDSVIFTNESALTGSATNWTGAQIVVRTSDWTLDTAQILTYTTSGGNKRISFSSAKMYGTGVDGGAGSGVFLNNYGFFIQNDPKTLDVQGEWYYNMSTKKFRIYLASLPNNYTIKVATQTYGMLIDGDDFITVQNLRFEGFNWDCIRANNTSLNKEVKNCEFQWGRSALWVEDGNSDITTFSGNTVQDMCAQGVFHQTSDNFVCRDNTFDRIAIWPGMGGVGFTAHGILATRSSTGNVVVARNIVRNVGYIGIRADNNNVRIDSNYVDNTMLTHIDGGGIYLGNFDAAYTNRKIRWNIVLNTKGNYYGTSSQDAVDPFKLPSSKNGGCIYLDDFCHDVEIAYNVVGSTGGNSNGLDGMYLHNNRNLNIHDNLIYSGYGHVVFFGTHVTGSGNGTTQNRNPATEPAYRVWGTHFQNNILIARKRKEFVMRLKHDANDSTYIKLFDEAQGATPGTNVNDWWNDNIISRPVNQDSITFNMSWSGSGAIYRTNTMWKNNFGLDSRSVGTPKQFQSNSIDNVDTVFYFYYNTEAADTTFALSRTLMDMTGGVHFSGESVTLPAYSGIVYLAHTAAGGGPPPSEVTSGHSLYKHANGKLYVNSRTGKLISKALGYVPQNLFVRSEELDNASWTKGTGITVTANSTTAPDATTTAELVAEDNATVSQKNTRQTLSVTLDTIYTLSAYVKNAGRDYVQLAMGANGFQTNDFADFSLLSGNVTLQGSTLLDAKMTLISDGWYRISITAKATASSASSNPQFTPIPTNTSGRLPSYAGTTGKNLYLWGLQLNTGQLKPYTKTVATNIP